MKILRRKRAVLLGLAAALALAVPVAIAATHTFNGSLTASDPD